MKSPEGLIRRMKTDDVPRVVAIHLESFHGFFLSFLGPRFLKLYYSYLCSDKESICFIHVRNGGDVTGFIAGSSQPRGFYSHLLKKHWIEFALASVSAILKKPSAARRLARAILHPSKNPGDGNVAGLFSISVISELHGSGIGRSLVQEFLAEAARSGCSIVFLTTDRDNNEAVNNFYLRSGFHIEREYKTPEGRYMNEYRINL